MALAFAAAAAGCSDDPPPPPPVSPPYVAAAKEAIAPAAAPSWPRAVRLVDATAGSGLEAFRHETGAFGAKYMPETMGAGVCIADLDSDGRLDVAVANGDFWPGHAPAGRPRPTPHIFRNLGGLRFEDRPLAGVHFYGMGVGAADLDRDGDRDLVFSGLDGVRFFRNEGALRFEAWGPEPVGPLGWCTALAFFDADQDGALDLLAGRYVRWSPETDLYTTIDGKTKSYATPRGYEGLPPVLLTGLASGRPSVRVLEGVPGKTLGIVVDDLDSDGLPDAILANDTEPNALLRNEGGGRFRDIAVEAGVAYDEDGRTRAGMGIDTTTVPESPPLPRGEGGGEGAADRSFRLAVAIANFSREPVSFFVAAAPGRLVFVDRGAEAGTARPTLLTLGFGLRFFDPDLDGDDDLLVANGHIEPEIAAVEKDVTYAEPLQLLVNRGDGTFALDPAAVPERPLVARGLATGDLDLDGDEDAVVTTNGGGLVLLRNDSVGRGRSERVEARDGEAGTVTLGRVEGGPWIRRCVKLGGSYLSQSDATLIFGLGEGTKLRDLERTVPKRRRE